MTEPKPEITLERLPGSPGCFVCDNDGSNPRALRLAIMWDQARAETRVPFRPDPSWCGYSRVVHGGLVASVLDEAMAWAVRRTTGQWAFTADFHLRYKRPLSPGQDYEARATVTQSGRKIIAQASIADAEGQIAAQAEAIFLPAPQAQPQSKPK